MLAGSGATVRRVGEDSMPACGAWTYSENARTAPGTQTHSLITFLGQALSNFGGCDDG